MEMAAVTLKTKANDGEMTGDRQSNADVSRIKGWHGDYSEKAKGISAGQKAST
jgi:DNA mismatch repair protein MutH